MQHDRALPLQQPARQAQMALPVCPPQADLMDEARRIWRGRPWFRRRYRRLADLLADPQCASLVLACARGAWLARQRTMR